jgi:hypothetical protein
MLTQFAVRLTGIGLVIDCKQWGAAVPLSMCQSNKSGNAGKPMARERVRFVVVDGSLSSSAIALCDPLIPSVVYARAAARRASHGLARSAPSDTSTATAIDTTHTVTTTKARQRNSAQPLAHPTHRPHRLSRRSRRFRCHPVFLFTLGVHRTPAQVYIVFTLFCASGSFLFFKFPSLFELPSFFLVTSLPLSWLLSRDHLRFQQSYHLASLVSILCIPLSSTYCRVSSLPASHFTTQPAHWLQM